MERDGELGVGVTVDGEAVLVQVAVEQLRRHVAISDGINLATIDLARVQVVGKVHARSDQVDGIVGEEVTRGDLLQERQHLLRLAQALAHALDGSCRVVPISVVKEHRLVVEARHLRLLPRPGIRCRLPRGVAHDRAERMTAPNADLSPTVRGRAHRSRAQHKASGQPEYEADEQHKIG